MPPVAGYVDFNPERDIPSLQGKVIFITGGTAGLGKESVLALARHKPAHIYFSGRNGNAADSVLREVGDIAPGVGITFVELDLTSLAAVKVASSKFVHNRLDILMCNAGIMSKPSGVSADGYEIHFATNHLGHAMLTQQLLPVMLKTAEQPEADVRLINLTSLGWAMHPRDGVSFSTVRGPQDGFWESQRVYGQSKLANIVYAAEIARRYPAITAVSVHPGVVKTDLVEGLSTATRYFVKATSAILGNRLLDPSQGRLSQLWAAAGARKEQLVNGALYLPVGVMSNHTLDKTAKSPEFAKKLWAWTQTILDEY
ncbi:hypothetical protein JX266_004564 [Neoarthrinium moseri]|nr:hypothetical protein JX266_004564 [Neoarthrinium moseri]